MDKTSRETQKGQKVDAELSNFCVVKKEPSDNGDTQRHFGNYDSVNSEDDYGVLIEPDGNLCPETTYFENFDVVPKESNGDRQADSEVWNDENKVIGNKKQNVSCEAVSRMENPDAVEKRRNGKDNIDTTVINPSQRTKNGNLNPQVIRNSTDHDCTIKSSSKDHGILCEQFTEQEENCNNREGIMSEDDSNLKLRNFVDGGENRHQCTVCHKTFSNLDNFCKHIEIHDRESAYSCEICHRKFTRKDYLVSHLEYHRGERTYVCFFCGRAFSGADTMRRHVAIHKNDKSFVCEICQREFKASRYLASHMITHTGRKPYECQECHKSFSRPGDFRRHKRIHTGEKPYECTECHKAFSQPGTLREHSRIHTGEKPYRCTVCQKTFKLVGTFRRHRRIHIVNGAV